MVDQGGGPAVKLGTVASFALGAPATFTLTVDEDTTTQFPVDYWQPRTLPTVGDRVLFDRVGRQIVVTHHVGAGFARNGTYTRVVASATTTAVTSLATGSQYNESAVSPFSAGVFTAPAADFYTVMHHADNIVNNATRGLVGIRVNGVDAARLPLPSNSGLTTGGSASTAIAGIWLNAGDTVDFILAQFSGANLTVTGYVTVRRGR
jgi:hypothetical protein